MRERFVEIGLIVQEHPFGVEKTIGVKDRNKIRDFIKKAKENAY